MKRILFQVWDKSTQVPFLAKMCDGSLIGTFSTVRWGRMEHGDFIETTSWNTKQLEEFYCRSTDGGHTWSLPEPWPYPSPRPWHPLGGEEYLGVTGLSADPDQHRLLDGSPSKQVLCLLRGRLHGAQMAWDPPSPIAPMGEAPANQGRLTRLLDGALLAYYSVIPPQAQRTYLAVRRSEDNGHTWGDEIIVDPIECSATGRRAYLNIVTVGDGSVAAFWSEARPQPFLRKSDDGGRTWSERRPLNPFRSPKTGRPYSYSKLQGVISLAEWGPEWYTDLLGHGRAADRRLQDPDDPGGLVCAHSYDGGYTWEETQTLDDCKDAWPDHLAELLHQTVGGMNTGYGNAVIVGNRVLLASPNVDAEALRQKCYLYDIPSLIGPTVTPGVGATAEPPGQFGRDAGRR